MLSSTRNFCMVAQVNYKNKKSINVLHKKCLRKMNFKPFNYHTYELFASDKFSKICDLIRIEQINLASSIHTNYYQLIT